MPDWEQDGSEHVSGRKKKVPCRNHVKNGRNGKTKINYLLDGAGMGFYNKRNMFRACALRPEQKNKQEEHPWRKKSFP